MKLGIKEKFVSTIAVSLAVVGVFALFYGYMASAVGQATSRLSEVEAQIKELETERRQARSLERILEEHHSDLERISAFSVSREHPIEFIEGLEGLAKKTGNLIVLGVDSTLSSKDLQFRVTLDGTETSVSKYLKLFELLPYELRIEDFSYQKITEGDKPAEVDTRLTMQISVKSR